MPDGGYTKLISNGTKSKKETLSPIENNVFSKKVLPNRSIVSIKNPGKKVSRAKPKTCLKIGTSRIMKMSVKAMKDSVNAHIVLESKLGIALSITEPMNSCRCLGAILRALNAKHAAVLMPTYPVPQVDDGALCTRMVSFT